MYGILKLQDKITKEPELGWRERYGAKGTEEVGVSPSVTEGLADPPVETPSPSEGADA
jgi:hypothetical protein